MSSDYETFEFVLPEFRRPEGYDDTGLFDLAADAFMRGSHNPTIIIDTFPWLKTLMPEVISDQSLGIEAEQTLGFNAFRRFAADWHIDEPSNKKVVFLSTSTPTLFAECAVTINTGEILYDGQRNGSIDLTTTNFTKITNLFGNNWLEIYAGLNYTSIEARGSMNAEAPKLSEIIVAVEGLKIVQALPGVVAEGVMAKTLHKSAPRHPSSPFQRVFIQGEYDS